MTRVLLSPCATVVRARNTSAMPPVPILRISEYLPNCSMPPVRGHDRRAGRAIVASQRRDHEVVEPGIGLPVVEAEILVADAVERPRIFVAQERRRQVVDVPGDRVPAALDPPVIVPVGDH